MVASRCFGADIVTERASGKAGAALPQADRRPAGRLEAIAGVPEAHGDPTEDGEAAQQQAQGRPRGAAQRRAEPPQGVSNAGRAGVSGLHVGAARQEGGVDRAAEEQPGATHHPAQRGQPAAQAQHRAPEVRAGRPGGGGRQSPEAPLRQGIVRGGCLPVLRPLPLSHQQESLMMVLLNIYRWKCGRSRQSNSNSMAFRTATRRLRRRNWFLSPRKTRNSERPTSPMTALPSWSSNSREPSSPSS